jgi:hypothetical protein
MKRINQGLAKRLILVITPLFLASCASIPEMQVLYRLPPPSEKLKNKKIALTVKDDRESKTILKKGAKEEFEGFAGNISLSVAAYDDEGFRIGIFQVTDLMEEALKRRLENQGIKTVSEHTPGRPELLILLKAFTLDFEGRDWVAHIGYEAQLIKDNRLLANQIINAEGQRMKIIGRGQADTLMGEIFSDAVNALDLARLFSQAQALGH